MNALIRAELPDITLEFPDDTPDEVINGAVKTYALEEQDSIQAIPMGGEESLTQEEFDTKVSLTSQPIPPQSTPYNEWDEITTSRPFSYSKVLEDVKGYESFRDSAYYATEDEKIKGISTIGYGNTEGVKPGDTMTEEEASKDLQSKLIDINNFISSEVKVPLNHNQRSSLISLIYNVGKGSFSRSKALAALNSGDTETFLSEAFSKNKGWTRQSGKILNGLVKRRASEQELFNTIDEGYERSFRSKIADEIVKVPGDISENGLTDLLSNLTNETRQRQKEALPISQNAELRDMPEMNKVMGELGEILQSPFIELLTGGIGNALEKRAMGMDLDSLDLLGAAADLPVLKGIGMLGSVGGKLARGADIHNLIKAVEADRKGISMDTINKDFSWFKSKDGKWRFEIPDNKARLHFGVWDQDTFRLAESTSERGFLIADDIYDHDLLMDAYPSLRSVRVGFKDLGKDTKAHTYIGDNGVPVIEYNSRLTWDKDSFLSTGLHELTHNVQRKEHFARGGNRSLFEPDGFKARKAKAFSDLEANNKKIKGIMERDKLGRHEALLKNPELLENSRDIAEELKEVKRITTEAQDKYMRMLGEVEARTVQKRINYTPQQRKDIPFYKDYEPEYENVILRMSIHDPVEKVK